MKAQLSLLQSSQIVNTFPMAFQLVPVLSSLPMVLEGHALRWSQEVIGTAWHSGMWEDWQSAV